PSPCCAGRCRSRLPLARFVCPVRHLRHDVSRASRDFPVHRCLVSACFLTFPFRSGGDALEALQLALFRGSLAPVGQSLALVGGVLPGVRQQLALVGDALPLVRQVLAPIGAPVVCSETLSAGSPSQERVILTEKPLLGALAARLLAPRGRTLALVHP